MSTTTSQTMGRYELLAKLATGGMGEIYLARLQGRAGFEKLVVVKRLLAALAPTGQYVAMFFDEARLAARLAHPNVCEVYDLGEDAGSYYIVMQYLEGVPLSRAMVAPPGQGTDAWQHLRFVVGALAQACEGLHHAHELAGPDGRPLGVVHRDVSPSNLFVTSVGVVKVLDFGIAKAHSATSVTEPGLLKGKFAYMSPEQIADGGVDRRADVFCMGIVAWEAVTGQRLFKRDSPVLAAKAIIEEPAPDARERAGGDAGVVPVRLARVLARALEREPEKRFATARELGAALREAMSDAEAGAGGVMAAEEMAEVVKERFGDELEQQRERARGAAETKLEAGDAGEPGEITEVDGAEAATTQPRVLAGVSGAGATVSAAGAATSAAGATASAVGRGWKPWLGPLGGLFAIGVGLLVMSQLSKQDKKATRGGAPVRVVDAGADAMAMAVAVVDGGGAQAVAIDAGRVRPSPSEAAPRQVGYLSIDSTPYAVITLDGKTIGETPIIRRALPVGRHKLTARLQDGRTRKWTVEVSAGVESPTQLAW